MKDFEYTEADDKLEQRRQIKKTIKKIKRDNWSDDKIIEMLKSIHFNFI
jgi:Txe/YoeB family toxin of Txe-Axe toxin-antitoxin module